MGELMRAVLLVALAAGCSGLRPLHRGPWGASASSSARSFGLQATAGRQKSPAGRLWAADEGFGEVELQRLLRELDRNDTAALRKDEALLGDRAEELTRAAATASAAPPKIPQNATRAETASERQEPRKKAEPADSFRDFIFPAFDIESLGIGGDWEELGGNLVLRPPDGAQPRAVIHFLGGAFVGATPAIAYRYLLQNLAKEGFLIVATPYKLQFDYLKICDSIIERFDQAAIPLAEEYGGLPVVGIGHSAGALLHSLITSLFPETPRAGNVLISWNNRPAADAIPAFEETIVPVSKAVWGDSAPARDLRRRIATTRRRSFALLDTALKQGLLPTFWKKELYPLVQQADGALQQLPSLLKEVADGVREFSPTPADTRNVLRKLYRARRTLVIGFDDDTIDESEVVVACLRESTSVWRMKRPMIDVEMDVATLTGTHITPLSQDLVPEQVVRKEQRRLGFLEDVEGATDVILSWLTETLMENVRSERPQASAGKAF